MVLVHLKVIRVIKGIKVTKGIKGHHLVCRILPLATTS
jgi:hypothetical protein